MTTDPYAALGLTKAATDEAIKKAYRKIARTSHPDLNPNDARAEARFKAASAAYDVLKDPETRARFDRGEIDGSGAERPQRQYYRDYADAPNNPYRSGAGRAGAGGSGPRPEDFGDTSDIFAEFLRQQGQPGMGQPGSGRGSQGFAAPGPDLRYTLEVAFLDAATGAKTRITLPDGVSLEVKIPEGATDGQTLRLRGKGGPGYGGGAPGDALISLSVRPHPLFQRDGSDILIVLPISIDEAVLGGKVETPTIHGPVSLTIPKGATSGQILRLRGRGVKPAGAAPAGDQRVELRIKSPPRIDEALAAFMETWRKTNAYDPREGIRA